MTYFMHAIALSLSVLTPMAAYAASDQDRVQQGQAMEDSVRSALHSVMPPSPYPCSPGSNPPAPATFGAMSGRPAMTGSCDIGIGMGALWNSTTMYSTIAVGTCSGASLKTESRDILIGDYTSAPRGRDGFVNIANKWCWWRDSGAQADCPPPEPECNPPLGEQK